MGIKKATENVKCCNCKWHQKPFKKIKKEKYFQQPKKL